MDDRDIGEKYIKLYMVMFLLKKFKTMQNNVKNDVYNLICIMYMKNVLVNLNGNFLKVKFRIVIIPATEGKSRTPPFERAYWGFRCNEALPKC